MKKLIATFTILLSITAAVLAQSGDSFYVSANGNADNDGLSESRAFNSLEMALWKAQDGTIRKITVIGTVDKNTSPLSIISIPSMGYIFSLGDNRENPPEILITGKPGATGAERAVLSGRGSKAGVVAIANKVKIRFEHIEISNGKIRRPLTIGE